MANKLLGQHFLKDGGALRKIVEAIDPQKNDVILEVGPGHGELTRPLAEACAKSGCTLVTIEKDQRLAAQLEQTFAAEPVLKDVRVITGDILLFIKEGVRGGKKPTKIVGNIPYYLSAHLLRLIGEMEGKPDRCVFTMQREVAERITAAPPAMSKLAASVQFWATPSIALKIPKTSFTPPPQVDSALIVLDLKAREVRAVDADRYYRAIHALFAQPRKTIYNNLRAALGTTAEEEDAIRRALLSADASPSARPQDLDVPRIIMLAKALF